MKDAAAKDASVNATSMNKEWYPLVFLIVALVLEVQIFGLATLARMEDKIWQEQIQFNQGQIDGYATSTQK